MKVQVIGVGNQMPSWVQTACDEYIKRMAKPLGFRINEIRPAGRNAQSSVSAMEQECRQIVEVLDKERHEHVIALDVTGKSWSTPRLANALQQWMMQGENAAFIIGGADGLGAACLARATLRLSLSAMTLPHTLARVVLLEQLYRAYTITIDHPYHRE
jgi:23S rRNA (pseudouridine1915-N3)-methyltransferase